MTRKKINDEENYIEENDDEVMYIEKFNNEEKCIDISDNVFLLSTGATTSFSMRSTLMTESISA